MTSFRIWVFYMHICLTSCNEFLGELINFPRSPTRGSWHFQPSDRGSCKWSTLLGIFIIHIIKENTCLWQCCSWNSYYSIINDNFILNLYPLQTLTFKHVKIINVYNSISCSFISKYHLWTKFLMSHFSDNDSHL